MRAIFSPQCSTASFLFIPFSTTRPRNFTMAKSNPVFDLIKKHDAKYVDLRFTDPRGKLQHVTQHIDTINEEAFEEGLMFDGSSIAGWKAINESDMTLMLDAETAVMDPFYGERTVALYCDVYDPST